MFGKWGEVFGRNYFSRHSGWWAAKSRSSFHSEGSYRVVFVRWLFYTYWLVWRENMLKMGTWKGGPYVRMFSSRNVRLCWYLRLCMMGHFHFALYRSVLTYCPWSSKSTFTFIRATWLMWWLFELVFGRCCGSSLADTPSIMIGFFHSAYPGRLH
jgi:hypothetical protein